MLAIVMKEKTEGLEEMVQGHCVPSRRRLKDNKMRLLNRYTNRKNVICFFPHTVQLQSAIFMKLSSSFCRSQLGENESKICKSFLIIWYPVSSTTALKLQRDKIKLKLSLKSGGENIWLP